MFGTHTPYVLASYAISLAVIGALIVLRWRGLAAQRQREAAVKGDGAKSERQA